MRDYEIRNEEYPIRRVAQIWRKPVCPSLIYMKVSSDSTDSSSSSGLAPFKRFRKFIPWPQWLQLGLGLGLLQLFFAATSALSAERIIISYGSFERAIQIDDLEAFAKDGRLSKGLDGYANLFETEQLEEWRQALVQRIDLDVVVVSQFLYTPQGKFLLKQMSNVIRTEARHSGFLPIRAALVLAAADDEGLTLLNVMRFYPTPAIRFDLESGLQIVEGLERAVRETNGGIALVEQQAELEAENEPLLGLAQLPRVRLNGPYPTSRMTLRLSRFYPPVDLYLPEPFGRARYALFPAPVIVISHGLGSDRTTYLYLASYLAAYGFVVVSMEHPGSSAEQLLALLEARANVVVPDEEFINRPLDVKFVLDELENHARTNPRLRDKLDLQRVGVLGQSYGGYTTLALAGAPLNLSSLGKSCPPQLTSFNLSLLLQCQASNLPSQIQDLTDPRVKAAIAVNPIGSVIFGQGGFSQINIPLMILSSGSDTIAPALFEQIRPFTWLTTPNRYLLLISNATHFSTVGESSDSDQILPIPVAAIGPRPELAQRYLQVMSLAFFETYLSDNQEYRPLLSAAYVQQHLSQSPLPLSLIRHLDAGQLANAISNARDESADQAEASEELTDDEHIDTQDELPVISN